MCIRDRRRRIDRFHIFGEIMANSSSIGINTWAVLIYVRRHDECDAAGAPITGKESSTSKGWLSSVTSDHEQELVPESVMDPLD